MSPPFSRQPDILRDREDGGARLAGQLAALLKDVPREDIVAIGLARGGVIVAAEVARRLDVRLEAIVVRKLGAPDQPELAIGAITASGHQVLNTDLIANLRLREMEVDRIVVRATEAAHTLCDDLGVPPVVHDLAGKTAVLIDDGLATGATMRAAIASAKAQGATRVVIAVPVAPKPSIAEFGQIADDVVAILTPGNLRSVGQWYERFYDTPSDEVRSALSGSG